MNACLTEASKPCDVGEASHRAGPGGAVGHRVVGLSLKQAGQEFLSYLGGYQGASPLTVEAYARDLARLERFLRGSRLPTEVGQISSRHLQAFAVSLSGLAPASIIRALNATSSLFSYLVRSGAVESNPVAGVVKPRPKLSLPRVPSTEECRRLVQAAPSARERALVMLLLTAGLRRAEVLGLRSADLAADLSQVRISGKGGRERVIPLPAQTQQVLGEYLRQRPPGEWLFPNRAGRRTGNTTFYRLFRRLLRRAGLGAENLTPHSLRHAYATTLLHSRVDIKTVQTLLGHADLSSTSRYLHTDAETKRAAAEALPDFLAAAETGGDGQWLVPRN